MKALLDVSFLLSGIGQSAQGFCASNPVSADSLLRRGGTKASGGETDMNDDSELVRLQELSGQVIEFIEEQRAENRIDLVKISDIQNFLGIPDGEWPTLWRFMHQHRVILTDESHRHVRLPY